MVRRRLVSGNWKMNLDHLQAIHLVQDLGLRLSDGDVVGLDVSVHPPFTDLRSVQSVVEERRIPVFLGAQDCSSEDAGAYTGEVSPVMLARLHVTYVIAGHSERRRLFGETDGVVAAKLRAIVRNGMTPICCVGETAEERDAGTARDRLVTQVSSAVSALVPEQVAGMAIAYEPVWAIGTGSAATPGDAQEACAWVREAVGEVAGAEAADGVRVLYGGSVTPDNTAELVGQPDVDGVLVGGASLEAPSFVGIVRAANGAR
jgi:triosephosphate isomerase